MKRVLFSLLFLSTCLASFGQNQIFMNPVKYTDRHLDLYQSSCGSPASIHLFINGTPVPSSAITPVFIVPNYYSFLLDFGLMKPGDVFRVTDDCGNTPFEQVVKDDYVYVEVPGTASYAGNGIDPNAQYEPYSKLSTPVQIGKCETGITIGSHGHANYYLYDHQATNGTFFVNGVPLTDGSTAVSPNGHTITHNGYPGTVTYQFNPDGSLTSNGPVTLYSNTYFSGQTPITFEYQHKGAVVTGDLSFGFKAMAFRNVSSTVYSIEKASVGGQFVTTTYNGNFANARFKVVYDGQFYRAYVNNVLIDELPRFVEYEVSSGTLTTSGALPYGSKTSWSGMNSGAQWVSVLVDGVLYTRQQFQVAGDLVVNPAVTDVACGGNTGRIAVSVTGGKAPFQYALNTGAYVSSNVFSGLTAGSYAVKVRDVSGCVATRNVTVGSAASLQLQAGTVTPTGCQGAPTGSVLLSATGGTAPYTYSLDGTTFVTTALFSALDAKSYTFTVKDAAGCVATVVVAVPSKSKLLVAVDQKKDISCYGGTTGLLSLTTAGSVVSGTLQYSIDNGATFQSSASFPNLGAGTYAIVVKDDNCSVSLSQTLTQPTPLQNSTSVQQTVSCQGGQNGILAAAASGGVAPYNYSLNGTAFSTVSTFSNLSAGSYKTWVKDANGCVTESGIVAMTEPAAVAVTVLQKKDVTCFGGSDGTLNMAGSGGTLPYQFSKDGTTFQSAAGFSGLTAATYTITMKDAKGCQATVPAGILQPTDIALSSPVVSPALCFGGATGSIQLTGSGGTGALAFSLDGTTFGSSPAFPNLTAGNYQVTAKDGNGCLKKTGTIAVSQPSALTPAVVKADVLCFGGGDGQVTLSASGGTPAYQFSKDGTNFQASGVFGGLSAGNYSFTVRDAQACLQKTDVTIGQPTALEATVSIGSQVLCYGGNSGLIRASASGGTTAYQYSLDGTTYQTSADFGTLTIGTYKIWVKDAHQCVRQTETVTLTQPSDLLASVSAQADVSCYGGSNGQVTLAAAGGVTPYGFALGSGAFQTAPTFTGLQAVSYSFSVRDGNGCIKKVTADVKQPAQPFSVKVVSQGNLTCYQAGSGRLEVAGSGGTAPYQVSLDNTSFQSSGLFQNLSAGNYTVYGKDANQCTFELKGISLSQPTDITVTLLSKKDVDCEYYQKGEALVTASGSNGNFSYTLEGADFQFHPISAVTNTTGFFDNLKAGDYTVQARDQAGCVKDFVVTIIPKNTNISFDVKKTTPTTCTSEDGLIEVIGASGGRPPYQYSISSNPSFSPNATFPGLLNGTYLVTVADELCSYKKEVDLTVPGSLRLTYDIQPVSCATPVANLQVTGTTGGNGNYTYSLNNAPYSSGRTFTGLHPNVYSLAVQDSPLTCRSVTAIEIKEQNRADLQITSRQNVLCFGGNSGRIVISGNNNMGPFTYSLNKGAYGPDGTFAGLTAGTYRLYAQNRIGCIDSLQTVLVQPTALSLTSTPKGNLCYGDKTGRLEASGNGGTPAYRFSLDGTTYQPAGIFDSLTAGKRTLYLKDANGCIQTQQTEIIQPTLLTLNPVYQDTVRCFGEANGKVAALAAGGTPGYRYSMDGTNYLSSEVFGNLAAGSYSWYVKDQNGCVTQASRTVTQPDLLTLALQSQTDPLCYGSKDGIVRLRAAGGNGRYLYAVDNAGQQAAETFSTLPEGSFSFSVVDRKGCTAALSAAVRLTSPAKIATTYTTRMPACFGESNGGISLNVTGGTPAYQAIFRNQVVTPDNTGFTFAGVPAGLHDITIRDAHGCTEKVAVTVSEPTALDGSVVISNNKCFGDFTGKISVTGSGATPAYQYALGTGDFGTSGSFDGLRANAYTISIRDANGCTLSKDLRVTEPPLLALRPINADTVRCAGEANGSILVRTQGGTPGYVFSKDGTQYYSDSTFRQLTAGQYRFWVKDVNACLSTAELTIQEPPRLDLSLTARTNPACAGEQNGTISLSAAGGNGGYVYWKDNALSQQTGVFSQLSQGEYTFKVLDRKGCQDTVTSVKLIWPASLNTQLSWQAPVCRDDANGKIMLSAQGGTAPYNAVTSTPTSTALSPSSWEFTGLKAGRYSIATRDANGCLSLSSVTLPEPDAIRAIVFPVSEPVCKGQEVVLDAGNPGMSTSWYFAQQELTAYRNKPQLPATDPGTYSVTVRNSTGCEKSQSYVLVNSNNALKADFLMTVQAFVGDTVRVLDISSPTPDEIKWELPVEANVIENQTTRMAFAFPQDGKYTIKMLARKGDCLNTKVRVLEIFQKDDIGETDSLLHYEEINVIQSMEVSPNPNFGKFTVKVKLSRSADAALSINRVSTSALIYTDEKKGADTYTFDVSLKDFIQDTYIVTVRVGKSVFIRRVVLLN